LKEAAELWNKERGTRKLLFERGGSISDEVEKVSPAQKGKRRTGLMLRKPMEGGLLKKLLCGRAP